MTVTKPISDLFFYFDKQTYRSACHQYYCQSEIKKSLEADAEWFLILADDLGKGITVEELVDDFWKRL
tara:strand:- start:106 stop:309 length:204 start_codon:yes stop_codon:yes gene_type:complete